MTDKQMIVLRPPDDDDVSNDSPDDPNGLIWAFEHRGKRIQIATAYDNNGPSLTLTAWDDDEPATVGVIGFDGDIIVTVEAPKWEEYTT
jgi:hypothetical protein